MGAAICARLAMGESLRSITRQDGMPDITTVYDWMAKYPAFAQQYARAREDQADTLADEITEIADRAMGKSAAEVNAARLAVDARKWVAAKLKPKKYSDKVDMTHSGPDGQAIPMFGELVLVKPGERSRRDP